MGSSLFWGNQFWKNRLWENQFWRILLSRKHGRGSCVYFTLLILLATPFVEAEEVDQELRHFLQNTINQSSSFKDRYDAEVWLISMSGPMQRFIDNPEQRLDLLRAIHKEATITELQPDLILALIEIESGFDRFAVSRAGAQGLMQVMPFWKGEIGRPEDNLTDINTNLRYGCRILQFYLKKEHGHIARALARYNGSVGKTWYPEKVMTAWQKHWLAGAL